MKNLSYLRLSLLLFFLVNIHLSAQDSTIDTIPPQSNSTEKGLKVAATLSDWVNNGTQIYNLSERVGIGTSTPGHKLDILHSGGTGIRIKSTSSFSVVDIDGFSGDAALRFYRNGTTQWNVRNRPSDDNFEIFESGISSRMIIQNTTGNIGINDNNPEAKLSVGGSIKIVDGNQAIGKVLTSNASGLATWQANPTSPWLVSGVNIYYPAGKVGINVANPNGQLQLDNSVINRKLILFENANNDHQFYGFGINSSTLRYQVDTPTSAHVFFAASSSSTSKELLRISGNGNITAAGVISFTSDKRLKKDITPLENVLPKVSALNSYYYHWSDETKSQERQIGFMAQEVEKLFPELVSNNNDGFKSINYIGLIPVLLEGMKELQSQLDKKEEDIKSLQSSIAQIKVLLTQYPLNHK